MIFIGSERRNGIGDLVKSHLGLIQPAGLHERIGRFMQRYKGHDVGLRLIVWAGRLSGGSEMRSWLYGPLWLVMQLGSLGGLRRCRAGGPVAPLPTPGRRAGPAIPHAGWYPGVATLSYYLQIL